MPIADPPSASSRRARGIDRAIELLECLHAAHEPLRIGELARRLNAPRSTVYELVDRLLAAALLETCGERGVFFGRSMHFYAAARLAINDFARQAAAAVDRLAETTGQTAQYTALQGNKYVVEHMRSARQLFRISADVGVPVPIPWTASGRLLLGHLSRSEILAFIPPEDFVLPQGRRLDPEGFCAEVAAATAAGICLTRGLVDDYTNCMAAPVRDGRGVAIGCLCLIVPHATPAQDALLARLAEAADALARQSGVAQSGIGGEAVAAGAPAR